MLRPGSNPGLRWQSKAVLLLVVPLTAIAVLVQTRWWLAQAPVVAWTTMSISCVFGLVVWRLRAGTAWAAVTGTVIAASLMYSYSQPPYQAAWLHGPLMPLLAVFLLTYAATKLGRNKKQQLGIGEDRHGRNAAQVAANLGVAALAWPLGTILGSLGIGSSPNFFAVLIIAPLAEAAADTVSSEIGQAFGGTPRMLTTLRKVAPGTDGGVTLLGTATGCAAAAIVAAVGGWALGEGIDIVLISAGGAMLGLFFDSLLGAIFERRNRLNNDAVNFLSTLSAPIFAVPLAVLLTFARSYLAKPY